MGKAERTAHNAPGVGSEPVFVSEITRRDSACRGSRSLSALETLAAKNRAPLCGPERNGSFAAALGTNRGRFNPPGRPDPFRRIVLPLDFARFAALRFVPEILFVVKLLFARGEDEVRAAVHTS
jgi:hypothetical protein